ncbi:MAG: hypothetical protein BV456_07905 [Thermoplasmata archaeon M8B2D]|nr:MAG: hypothetical protein BV456_07905 [Thermoplasmata archaeon M8B2D]
MKNQFTNIALEGTGNGDVVGGLYREPRENLQALLFVTEIRNPQESGSKLSGATVGVVLRKGKIYVTVTK